MRTMVALAPEVEDLISNPVQLVQWLGTLDQEQQIKTADETYEQLLDQAAQPKSLSGNACTRLCGFVDQSSKGQSQCLRSWAVSQPIVLELFNFYIEWNESDHHRSMKLVIDLITQLLKRQRDGDGKAHEIRQTLLDSLMSIVTGKSTKPVAKSAHKTLDYFLSKNIVSLGDLKSSFLTFHPEVQHVDELGVWERIMMMLFRWMRLHFVCPTAGKLILTIYCKLRKSEPDAAQPLRIETWHKWLLQSMGDDTVLLEGIKNYIFLPLFKSDRADSLAFLRVMRDVDELSQTSTSTSDLDLATVLRLAALQTGKKVGLVEDPDVGHSKSSSDKGGIIALPEALLGQVLAHPSHEVRITALSLLVTSPSTTRPYTPIAFKYLREHIASFFSDSDPKFRGDVLSHVREMLRRVRGAILILERSILRAKAKSRSQNLQQENKSQQNGGAQPAFYRVNVVNLPESDLEESLGHHEEFLSWYIAFLRSEMIPTASYQRHITSLKSLQFLLRMESESGKSAEAADNEDIFHDMFDSKWARTLLDLVMDPFDDVRELASAAVKTLYSDQQYRKFTMGSTNDHKLPARDLADFRQRAEELARRTSRADHSDGLARACQLQYRFLDDSESRISFLQKLISELDSKIRDAENDLGRAVIKAPLHGDFAALCSTWLVVSDFTFTGSELKALQGVQGQLVDCCQRVWRAVEYILCDDSPEGHLPQELEDVEGLDTKDLLSYSFRSIHESSNLMRTMALTMKNASNKDRVCLSPELFGVIGNLTFEQLTSLRHRGAFTTVSLTFATCCKQTKFISTGTSEESLLQVWYKGTMEAIYNQASTTRRSAGIPSLMTGILSANAPDLSLEMVIQRLMEVASIEARNTESDGSQLPQVHASNCLKDIFKNSLLTSMGNKSEKYLPACLELAASGLRSEVWAIRNCSLILLRSLIDNLFGCHESKAMIEAGWDGKTNRIPYHRYPNLPKTLIHLLKTGHKIITDTSSAPAAAESVFPALDIIRRAGPPEKLREEVQQHVAKYLASPVWHVREIAARTLCSCLLHKGWLETVMIVFKDALANKTNNLQNHVHGALLTVKFLVERLGDVAPELLNEHIQVLTLHLSQLNINHQFRHVPDILGTYLELVNHIWTFQRSKSQTFAPVDFSMPERPALALLKREQVLSKVLLATQKENATTNLFDVLMQDDISADCLTFALTTLPTLWPPAKTETSTLHELCGLYMDVCLNKRVVDADTVALENLAEAFDEVFRRGEMDSLAQLPAKQVWNELATRPINPALSHAILRVSGCIMATMVLRQTIKANGLRKWGLMIADAGLDDKTFDMRFAAAESLRSFFAVCKDACRSQEHLPVLMALYDALNDDDDEIRDVASAASVGVLGQALVPLEAARNLQAWLVRHLGNSQDFRTLVVSRIIGANGIDSSFRGWMSASDQLDQALCFDDSLFAVEEQNLYIDEVRETLAWISVFHTLEWAEDDPALVQLAKWLVDGLFRLCKLAAQPDGPLGWASDPRVFAIYSSIAYGSVALEKKHGGVKLLQHLSELRQAVAANTSISGTLVEML